MMRRRDSCWIAAGILLVGPWSVAQVPADVAHVNPEDSNEAVRRIRLLDAYIKQSSWSEAAELLAQMIEAYPHQVLQVEGSKPPRFVSIRDYCHGRIAELPADALAQYRQRVDSQAAALWKEYERTGEEATLLRIADEFFCSSVGDSAIDRLGDHALSRGWIDEALAWWSRLLPTNDGSPPEKDARLDWRGIYPDPKVDLARVLAKWTIAQLLRGDVEAADQGTLRLKAKYPDSEGELGGRKGTYSEIVTGLRADPSVISPTPTRPDWPTFAGNFSRTKIAPRQIRIGAVQHRWGLAAPRTKTEGDAGILEMDPRFMQQFARITRRPKREGLVCHPITVGPYVFVSDGSRLLQFHVDQDEPVFTFHFDSEKGGGTDLADAQTRQTLSLSGNYLFARTGTLVTVSQPPFPQRVTTTSRLYCFDHITRKLRWWKSADDLGIGPPVVFEGAPVVLGNQVIVGATRVDAMSTSYLVCLDAESDSGAVLWKRLICEASHDQENSPGPDQNLLTLADRTVYYCTNLGAVAALDVPTAKVKWLCEYDLDTPGVGGAQTQDVNTCIYHQGRLFVAPVGSSSIHCLDSGTGQTLWRCRVAANQMLGVANGLLIVAGARVNAVDVRTGAIAWSFPENMPGTAGRGLLAGDFVYWPTASEIHVLDQRTGKRMESAISLVEGLRLKPGNLVPGDGFTVLAQNRQLVVLRPNSWLKEKSLQLVEKNPNSADAHLQLAMSAADDEDFQLAMPHFQEAVRLALPDDMREGQRFSDVARSRLFEARIAAAGKRIEFARENEDSVRAAALADAEQFYRAAARDATDSDARYHALRLCAELKAAFGRPAEALVVYHEILADKALRDLLADAGPGRRRLVANMVGEALQAIVTEYGESIYEPWDRTFQQEVERVKDPRAILELAERFPLAKSGVLKLVAAGESLGENGRHLLAQQANRLALARAPQNFEERADLFAVADKVHGSKLGNVFDVPPETRLRRPIAGLSEVRWDSDNAGRASVLWTNSILGSRLIVSRHPSLHKSNLAEAIGERLVYRSEETGNPIWDVKVGGATQWITHAAAHLICGLDDRVLAMDYASGEILWNVALDPRSTVHDWKPASAGMQATATLAPARRDPSENWVVTLFDRLNTLHGSIATCVSQRGRIVQIDLDFGTTRWELDPIAAAGKASSDERLLPYLKDLGSILLAWSSHRVFAIEAQNGGVRWALPLAHDSVVNRAVEVGEVSILVTGRDRIVAVKRETGTVAWTKQTGWPSWDVPSLFSGGYSGASGVLLALLDGYALCRIDPRSGETLWEVAVTRSPQQGLGKGGFLREGEFYLATAKGLECWRIDNGTMRWRGEAAELAEIALMGDAETIVGLETGRGLPRVKAWNLQSGRLERTVRLEPAGLDVRFVSLGGVPGIVGERRREAIAPSPE